ncbi:calcium-binding protein [Primorskyibacter sp. S187A]|uniref:calcium-binding protein n=1 Tax=Primorskyibacter sp. S187A TaxID=3415130 RepID=UPI003C7D9C1A
MAFEILSTNRFAQYEIDSNDTVTLLEGVTLATNADAFVPRDSIPTLNNVTLNILGTIVSEGDAFDFFVGISAGGLTNLTINIARTAKILSSNEAIVTQDGANQRITNYGEIFADVSGIYFEGTTGSYIENHGYISSQTHSGVYAIGVADLIPIINTGTIVGIGSSFITAGVLGQNVDIQNSGTIIGREGIAVYVDSTSSVTNSGLIQGDVLSDTGSPITVANSGTITGDVILSNQGDSYTATGDGSARSIQMLDGNDTVLAGNVDDNVFGGAGADSLVGRDGDDTMQGEAGNDTMRGGAGNDDLYGGDDRDEIHGGSGDDYIEGGNGSDILNGNSGDDVIFGDVALDTINGGSGDDTLNGGANDDEVAGGSGDDLIRGEGGSDELRGGAGDDTLSGSTGDDTIDAGSGNDRIFGGANNDVISGSLGDDFIDAGSGSDSIRGGSGDDTIDSGSGRDTISGGNGADVFVFNSAGDSPNSSTRDTITDFTAGEDIIDLSGFAGTLTFVSSYTGAGNEVRYNDFIGRLYISTDTDAASEFTLNVGAGAGLTEDDLIL